MRYGVPYRGSKFQSTPSARRATAEMRFDGLAERDFNPRPPRGGRPCWFARLISADIFQSTPSARRATGAVPTGCLFAKISIHALREEGDKIHLTNRGSDLDFNPRPPRGGRLWALAIKAGPILFQSTPSARRATKFYRLFVEFEVYFNPRPPRGGRPLQICTASGWSRFQSTPSARRATVAGCGSKRKHKNFNPRPPRGGRRGIRLGYKATVKFQSTPSARRATPTCAVNGCTLYISIHALREEGDLASPSPPSAAGYFNPRPPRGGRPAWPLSAPGRLHYFNPRPPRGGRPAGAMQMTAVNEFQSTPSARRATCFGSNHPNLLLISIHALREEGDDGGRGNAAASTNFNPRPPRGGRQQKRRKIRHVCSIIHTCAQFEKELYKGSGEMQNKSC